MVSARVCKRRICGCCKKTASNRNANWRPPQLGYKRRERRRRRRQQPTGLVTHRGAPIALLWHRSSINRRACSEAKRPPVTGGGGVGGGVGDGGWSERRTRQPVSKIPVGPPPPRSSSLLAIMTSRNFLAAAASMDEYYSWRCVKDAGRLIDRKKRCARAENFTRTKANIHFISKQTTF